MDPNARDDPMTLYPPGHPPFTLWDDVPPTIRAIADKTSRLDCLRHAAQSNWTTAWFLEILRAHLFRSEQLVATEPLPEQADEGLAALPGEVRTLLRTMEAARRCLEAWLESPTCLEILAKYPRQEEHPG
jgi:hypothetical protein